MTKILHVNINVLQLDRSIAFYAEALGFQLVERHEATGYQEGDLRVAYLRGPDCPIEIELSEYAGRHEPYDYGGGKFGFAHFAVCVDDLEQEHRRLSRLASTITPIEDYVANGRRMSRYFFMRDPDGFPIEVIERNDRYR